MTLYNMTKRLSMRLWSRVRQLRFPSIEPIFSKLKYDYVVGTQKKRLDGMVLLSTQHICSNL